MTTGHERRLTTLGPKLGLALAAALLTAACGASLPSQPRYATRISELPPPPPPVTAAPAPEAMEPRHDEVLPPVASREVEVEALPPVQAAPSPTLEFGRPEAAPTPPSSLRPGAAYVVQPGDTVSGVGRRFGVPAQSLIVLNGLGPQGSVRAGQSLILPDTARDLGPDPYATGPSPRGVEVAGVGVPPPPPIPSPPPPPINPEDPVPPQPGPGDDTLPSDPPRDPPTSPSPPPPPPPVQRPGQPVIATTDFPDAAELARRAAGRFQWPVRGEILTRFGVMGSGLRNDGINIAAPAGTEVRAAAAGQVAYAGDSLPGLGTTVVIVHGDGWVTAYSHLGSTAVRMEQTVRQGQAIGTAGATGGVSQPQVHFEIRYTPSPADRPRPVDPLPLLD